MEILKNRFRNFYCIFRIVSSKTLIIRLLQFALNNCCRFH